jgi:glucokinase
MTEQLAIGVDIGGTKIGFALINEQGQCLATHRLPTNPAEGVDAVLDRVAQGIRFIMKEADRSVTGIGIGCPGHINTETGIVQQAGNLGWFEVPLRAGVGQRLNIDLPIWLGIDANANTLGELYFGAAREYQDFIYVAIGTGIGGGAVVNGELVLGANSYAMEIGHIGLDINGRHCTVCGMRGCPEMYVSGVGLLAGAREHLPDYPQSSLIHTTELSTVHILAAARAQDELALAVMAEATEWLYKVLICCTSMFNPALIVIGGGLGHAAPDFFIDGLKEQIFKRTVPMSHQGLKILESQVNNSAIGAACLVWQGIR